MYGFSQYSVWLKILKTLIMNEKILNYWIMYHEIHRFKRLGFSSRRIAQHFELDSRN